MTTHDILGVGIGPFNLSLAALADPVEDFSVLMLDEKPAFSWHPGLLIEGTTLQVPFLADLVTMIDPTSRWSFLSYLADHERLFPFYFAENFHVSRREYDHYCRWAAENLPSCRFGRRVTSVRWDDAEQVFHVEAHRVESGETERYSARNVVLGVGTTNVVPDEMRDVLGDRVFHSADYLNRTDSLRRADDITVLGSGQSGAEVFLDLLHAPGATRQRLRWLTRSQAFAPMEYSKLGLEHFTPDYTRYFHSLPQRTKDQLVPTQWQLYKASSADTLAGIHQAIYDRLLEPDSEEVTMMPNVAVTGARHADGAVELACHQREQDRTFRINTERVVLATGYRAERPECVRPLEGLLDTDEHGRYRVDDQYRVALDDRVTGGLYVQNGETHTHGVGAPDLGLGSHRAAVILNAVTGRKAYALPERTAFTTFGLD